MSPRHGLAPANGLPEPLRTNIEAMSGLAMDDVRVHRNSSRPAALGAHAFTEGAEIHLAPAQERHLPHEAWHAVQQKQGRVPATLQMKGTALNADSALEREADTMGARAAAGSAAEGAAAAPRSASTPGVAVIQREATKEEKELLRARVGDAFDNYKFDTQSDIELAIGLSDYYRLIKPKGGKPYWRRYKLKIASGRGFYGRLTDKPPSMDELGKQRAYAEALMSAPEKYFAQHVEFAIASSPGKRESNNAVMGKYFLGKGDMSAKVYALTGDCEWLHMQGHGLGGSEVDTNLYAGSNAANSQMAAVETAVQALRSIPGTDISISVSISVNEDYHTQEVCAKIAGWLGLKPGDVYAAMAKQGSRMPEEIVYNVFANGKWVWTEVVDPFVGGRFDVGSFKQLQKRVMEAIKGKKEEIKFVKGETLFPSSSASALSSAPSSTSSSASFSSTSSSSSASTFASSSSSSSSSSMDI